LKLVTCFCHLVSVFRNDDFVSDETQAVRNFPGEVVNTRRGRHGAGEFLRPMWPSPRDRRCRLSGWATFSGRRGELGGDAGAKQRRGGGRVEARRNAQDEASSTTTLVE